MENENTPPIFVNDYTNALEQEIRKVSNRFFIVTNRKGEES